MLIQSEVNKLIALIKSGSLTVDQALEQIATAQYGEDVRAAIYAAIYSCYNDGKVGAYDMVARAELAELLSADAAAFKVQQGISVVELTANTLSTVTVKYLKEFPDVPAVLLSNNNIGVKLSTSGRTAEGFTLNALSETDSTVEVSWVAIYGNNAALSEIEDIRIGANGTLYSTAGEAVREQIMAATASGNYLWGKKWCACGDGITYGVKADLDENNVRKTYQYYIGKRNGMTVHTNAVAGSTMANVSGKSPFSVDRYQNLPDDLDYITLWFGLMDSNSATLGTIEDTDNSTFFGAYNVVLNYLIDKYPLAKIGIVATYGVGTSYLNAIREIGKKFGIPVLDFSSVDVPCFSNKIGVGMDSAISAKRRAAFTADGTNPNDVGYQYMSTFFENWLRRL